jgi:general secretion pathway protein F
VPVFAYKGVTGAGRSIKGFVDADSPRTARSKLRRDGVFLTDLSEESAASSTASQAQSQRRSFSLRRISALDLALATRQLSTLIGAGIPLVTALSALTEQVESSRLKGVLAGVRDRVNEGASLAEALDQAGTFSDLFVGMVRAGEAGGALEQVLARLAEYMEGQVRLRNKVTSILIYPFVMFGFAMIVVGALVTVVLPQITELLATLNQELPFYTRAIPSGAGASSTRCAWTCPCWGAWCGCWRSRASRAPCPPCWPAASPSCAPWTSPSTWPTTSSWATPSTRPGTA